MRFIPKVVCFVLIFLVRSHVLLASPYPGMGSSALVDPQIGAFLTARGYSMNTSGTAWIPIADVDGSLRLQLPSQPAATLALHFDEVPPNVKLDLYAKKWAREYSQFGFEILGSQTVQLSGHESMVIDLVQKSKSQQLRQVLIKKEKKVAIFTCRDQQAPFLKTLPTCNQVIRTFRFLE
jgi:hypothetical protein